MEVDFSTLDGSRCYALMIRAITPRPIAWVSTVSSKGVPNLAPFSYFAGVGSSPPTLMFSTSLKSDGSPKDTQRNVEATGEFVVNIVPYSLRTPMAVSAGDFPYEESEFDHTGLTPVPSTKVQPPRLLESPINFECRVHEIVKIGSAAAVFGIIEWMHIDDRILNAEQKIDPELLDSIGRMGGLSYSRTCDRFEI
ncbi:MAG: flavin reductase family protein [Pirellulaceae bacterium]|nr:flavin reductase family protein [Pirellulaceae bacterium]